MFENLFRNSFNSTVSYLKNNIKKNKFQLIAISIISLFYISVLLYYTHGALLYNGDQYGYYSISQALSKLTPQSLLYAFSLALSLNNFYIAFYVALFISSFIAACCIYCLANGIFKGYIDNNYLPFLGIIAGFLYLFNPTIITNNTQSLIVNVLIYKSAFILFLYEVIILYRSKDAHGYKLIDSVIMGIALGLSLEPFPNYIRILLISVGIFSYFLIIKIFLDRKNVFDSIRIYIIGIFISILFTFIFSIYLLYPLILKFNEVNSVASYASTGFSIPSLYYGPYNIIFQVFRLMGNWAFKYVTYYQIYFTQPLIIISSVLWVILAILVPIILSDKNSYKIIIPIEILVILVLFWTKGANLPFGNLYLFITSHLPYGLQLIPTDFTFFTPSYLLLPSLYSVLTAYSIIKLYTHFKDKYKINISHQKFIFYSFIIIFMAILLISVTPLFNGKAESLYSNSTMRGYYIPNDYLIVKNYLKNNNVSLISIPAMSAEIKTSWGWQGTSQIYTAVSYPIKLYTISSLGSYATDNITLNATYINLTRPLKPSSNYTEIEDKFVRVGYINNTKIYSITYLPKKKLNLNNFTYIQITANVSNSTKLINIIKNDGLLVGLGSNNHIDYYKLEPGCWNCYITNVNNKFDIDLLLGVPNSGVTNSLFNRSGITKITFEFTNKTNFVNITSTPIVGGISGYTINNVWLNLTKTYNISYVLIDNSILSGNIENYTYVNKTIKYLLNSKEIKLVYTGNYLSLYKIT